MTEEEIKSLKIGDKFTVVFKVDEVEVEYVHLCHEDGPDYGGAYRKKWTLLEQATLVKPAPTFEVGDTVRIVPDPLSGHVHGVHYCQQLIGGLGVIEGIAEDDDENTMWIHMDGYTCRWGISPHCIELVKKAVKDKYYVKDLPLAYGINIAEYPDAPSIATFHKRTYPNAEAAAKAECARLNAEWREQQEGKEGADHE